MALPRNLVLAVLAGNVLLRIFTNNLTVLPKSLNIWDVLVTFALALVVMIYPKSEVIFVDTRKWLRRLALFDCVCIIWSLLNTEHVSPMAALSQLVMWNEPIVLFLALVHLPLGFDTIRRFRSLL